MMIWNKFFTYLPTVSIQFKDQNDDLEQMGI